MNGKSLPVKIDLLAAEEGQKTIRLGSADIVSGENTLEFEVAGSGRGTNMFSMDCIVLK